MSLAHHAFAKNYRHIEISQFRHAVSCEKDVRAFDIAVSYIELMQGIESLEYLYEDVPNIIFGELSPVAFVLKNFLYEVSGISILHDDAISQEIYQRMRLEES